MNHKNQYNFPRKLSAADLILVNGGSDPQPVVVNVSIAGNDFDSMSGAAKVTLNVPVTDTIYISPTVVVNPYGDPIAGGARVTWITPF